MFEQVTDPGVLEGYLTDASNVHGHADVLVRPRSTAEVAEIVSYCQEHSIALTVSAARTSTTAAPVPFGGWVLSTELLNQVGEIGHDHASAQAGVLLGEFQTAIEETGRFFPPDPTSRHECTLGAAIACNASGARSFKYGPTRPWIEALTVVLPNGEILRCKRGDPIPADWPVPQWEEPKVKTAAGYAPPADLVDLFIGQEGTLGIVTEATVRLTDLPNDILGFLLWFPNRTAAVDFVETARTAARANPSGDFAARCLEYFDERCLDIARERSMEVPEGAHAALFAEAEIFDHDPDDVVGAWWEALESSQALADDTLVAMDPPSREKLYALRHAIPAGVNERVVRNGMPKLGTDLAVPDSGLTEMMDHYEAAPMEFVLFGHIGDNHLHLNLLPTSEDELAKAKAFYDELADHAVQLGGTVSAEHGIGKIKRKQLRRMLAPATLQAFVDLKRALDPNWILGRGTLLDTPE